MRADELVPNAGSVRIRAEPVGGLARSRIVEPGDG